MITLEFRAVPSTLDQAKGAPDLCAQLPPATPLSVGRAVCKAKGMHPLAPMPPFYTMLSVPGTQECPSLSQDLHGLLPQIHPPQTPSECGPLGP